MQWMGKQNTNCYQRQRFRRRGITKSVRINLFGPDWLLCLWIQIRILILFNSPLYHHFSLNNDVSDIKTLSDLALIFVFLAKCLSKYAVVCLKTKKYERQNRIIILSFQVEICGFLVVLSRKFLLSLNNKELQMCLSWKAFLCGS